MLIKVKKKRGKKKRRKKIAKSNDGGRWSSDIRGDGQGYSTRRRGKKEEEGRRGHRSSLGWFSALDPLLPWPLRTVKERYEDSDLNLGWFNDLVAVGRGPEVGLEGKEEPEEDWTSRVEDLWQTFKDLRRRYYAARDERPNRAYTKSWLSDLWNVGVRQKRSAHNGYNEYLGWISDLDDLREGNTLRSKEQAGKKVKYKQGRYSYVKKSASKRKKSSRKEKVKRKPQPKGWFSDFFKLLGYQEGDGGHLAQYNLGWFSDLVELGQKPRGSGGGERKEEKKDPGWYAHLKDYWTSWKNSYRDKTAGLKEKLKYKDGWFSDLRDLYNKDKIISSDETKIIKEKASFEQV